MDPSTRSGHRPWERQKGESARAFHAFTHYRDLAEERSLDKAYRAHLDACGGKQRGSKEVAAKRYPGKWYEWYTRWRWKDRVGAHDAEIDRQKQAALAKEREESWERLKGMARLLFSKFVEGMRGRDAGALSGSELIRAAEAAAKLELQIIGAPTEHVRHSGAIETPHMEVSREDARDAIAALFEAGAIRLAADGEPSGEVDGVHPTQPDG